MKNSGAVKVRFFPARISYLIEKKSDSAGKMTKIR